MTTTRTTDNSQETDWVGLDVSKHTFDAAWVPAGQAWSIEAFKKTPAKAFERTPEGARALFEWLDALTADAPPHPVRFVMETTGKYSIQLAGWLVEQRPECGPAIANTRKTATFIKSLGLRNKTDKLDACALAFYGLQRTPEPYQPLSPEFAELRELSRHRDTLVKEKTAQGNREKETSSSAFVRNERLKDLRRLDRDIKRTEQKMKDLIKRHPHLQKQFQLLCTIDGVAFVTAVTVLAEFGDLTRFDQARQLSAFAGLSPQLHDSGTSVKKRPRMCKYGSPRVRQALYMAALTAVRGECDLQRSYQKHQDRGRAKMSALGVVMRKLLLVMRAILISGKPYNPNWKTRHAHAK